MERVVGGGIGMGNTCKPMAVSFQCMTKFTTNLKKKKNSMALAGKKGSICMRPYKMSRRICDKLILYMTIFFQIPRGILV